MNNNKSSENKMRFTFERRRLTIDPVPTIYYYKDSNVDTVSVDLIPLSVCNWVWNGCDFVEINKTNKTGC